LLSGERLDLANIREATEGLDKVGIPLCEDTRVLALLHVEDRRADVLFLADGGLALAVKVPDGLCEGLGDVGALALQCVPDFLGGAEIGFSAFEGTGNAEEADDVTVVNVEELAVMISDELQILE
jgi:hypothetical protein